MKKALLGSIAVFTLVLAFQACRRSVIKHRCCENEFEIITQYYQTPDSFSLYIPQAFTPNGDGLNDEFFPMGVGWKVQDIIIRKGSKIVFESHDYLEAVWDGGVEKDGQYNYRMTFRTDVGDLMEVKGDVCIMRFGQRGDKLPELEREKICDCTTFDMLDSAQGIIDATAECATNSALQ